MIDPATATIITATIGAFGTGIAAYINSRRTRRKIQLLGTEATVNNWNKLIKNLYGEIDRLNGELERERRRAETIENRLKGELRAAKLEAENEKRLLLTRIDELSVELDGLRQQIHATLPQDKGKTDG